jgi:hypothetical protein
MIRLYTASGWSHETTVDDPLFSPILGSMREEGITLPESLELTGSVGEVIERDWALVEVVKQWQAWDLLCQQTDLKKYVIERTLTREVIRSCRNDHPAYRPPDRVLYRREVDELSRILSLPEGWETYTIVDAGDTPIQRLYHMRASLNYTLSHLVQCDTLMVHTQPPSWSLLSGGGPSKYLITGSRSDTILDPFARNVWLQLRSGVIDGPRDKDCLTLNTLILHIDWQCVIDLLSTHTTDKAKWVTSLAKSLVGKGISSVEWSVPVDIDYLKFYVDIHEMCKAERKRITWMYEEYLSYMPKKCSIDIMGLLPILSGRISTSRAYNYVRRFVQTIHESIIVHSMDLPHTCLYTRMNGSIRSRMVLSISSELCEFLVSTIGLRAIRCIHECLMHHVTSELDAGYKLGLKGPVSSRNLVLMRADELRGALDDCIRLHDGEDEGVRDLVFRK